MILENFKLLATFGEGLMAPALLELQHMNQDLWLRHKERQSTPGSPHHSTQTIFLRGPKEFTLEEYFSVTSVDFPYERQALPELNRLADNILWLLGADTRGSHGRILIAKLLPQSEIDEHSDEGAYADHFNHRVHLSLVASGKDYLGCGNESVYMKPGELWWFNHKKSHMAENYGDSDRIHMILDYRK